MKIEMTENSAKLIAETEFEKECLKRIRTQTIESVRLTNDWDGEGDLVLKFKEFEWGR